MAADVEICESNGVDEEVTHDITDTDMGSVDEADLDPVANPIVPGEPSFEKYQRLHVVDMGGSSVIRNLKIWREGELGGSAVHKTNARETSYGGAEDYAQPTDEISTVATQNMPTSEPEGANLGIGGALDGELEAPGYSDYLVHQMQPDEDDMKGSTSILKHQYEEIA